MNAWCRLSQADLVESEADGGFGDVEEFGEVGWLLDAVAVGGFEESFGHEDTAGEVVGDDLFGWPGCVLGVVDAGAGVVDDVFVFVDKGEPLPGCWFGWVEGDDPAASLPVPVAAAGCGQAR